MFPIFIATLFFAGWFWFMYMDDLPYIKPADFSYGPSTPANIDRIHKMKDDCAKRTPIIPIIATLPLLACIANLLFS